MVDQKTIAEKAGVSGEKKPWYPFAKPKTKGCENTDGADKTSTVQKSGKPAPRDRHAEYDAGAGGQGAERPAESCPKRKRRCWNDERTQGGDGSAERLGGSDESPERAGSRV